MTKMVLFTNGTFSQIVLIHKYTHYGEMQSMYRKRNKIVKLLVLYRSRDLRP